MEWLAQIAKEHGLFVALVAYVLWEKREQTKKYLDIIQTLSEEVKDRLTKIENKIGTGRRRGDSSDE